MSVVAGDNDDIGLKGCLEVVLLLGLLAAAVGLMVGATQGVLQG